MKSKFLAVALALVIPTTLAQAGVESADATKVQAGTYEMDPSHASVAARVDHLGFSSTTIRFAKLAGKLTYDPATPESSTLDVTIDTSSLSTDWAARDSELRGGGFFNTAQFPTARFTATKLTKVDASHAKVAGQLTLLGVTKPVELDVVLLGTGTGMMGDRRIGFEARGSFNRSDFGMKNFLPAVGDKVSLVIDAEFSRK